MAKINGKHIDEGRLSVLKRPFTKSAQMDMLRQVTIQYYRRLFRATPLQFSVIDAALRMNKRHGQDVIRGVFNVGNYTRKELSILENLQHLEEDYNNARYEFSQIYNKATLPLIDMDIMLTTENTEFLTKVRYRSEFRSSLPKPPESIEDSFKKFDIHRDTTKTEKEFVEMYESFKDPQKREGTYLDKQEEQFLSTDPNKKIKPVILFVSNDASPKFRSVLEEHLKGGHIQNHSQYIIGPWSRAKLSFKEKFPDYYSEIIGNVKEEVEKGVYGIENETIKSFTLDCLDL